MTPKGNRLRNIHTGKEGVTCTHPPPYLPPSPSLLLPFSPLPSLTPDQLSKAEDQTKLAAT